MKNLFYLCFYAFVVFGFPFIWLNANYQTNPLVILDIINKNPVKGIAHVNYWLSSEVFSEFTIHGNLILNHHLLIATAVYAQISPDEYETYSEFIRFPKEEMKNVLLHLKTCINIDIEYSVKNIKLVKELVAKDGCLLFMWDNCYKRYRSKEQQEIIKMALGSNPYSIFMMKKISLEQLKYALSVNGDILFGFPELQDIKEFVMIAVKSNGLAIRHASRRMKTYPSVAFVAVSNNGLALEYFSTDIKEDQAIIFTAIKQNPHAFEFIDNELKKNVSFVHQAITVNCKIYALFFESFSYEIKHTLEKPQCI